MPGSFGNFVPEPVQLQEGFFIIVLLSEVCLTGSGLGPIGQETARLRERVTFGLTEI